MRRDPTEFRKRFALYKQGKSPYKNGRPAEAPEESYTPYNKSIVSDLGNGTIQLPAGYSFTYGFNPDAPTGQQSGMYIYKSDDPEHTPIEFKPIIQSNDPDKARSDYWGNVGRDYMYHGMNTGFGKTMQNFANLIAGSAAGTAIASSGAIGSAVKSAISNPIYQNAAKQLLTSTIGGESVNLGSKALTGRTIGENVADLVGVDKNSGWRLPTEFIGEFLNPGYLLSPNRTYELTNAADASINYFTNKGNNIIKKINKDIHVKYRLNRAAELAKKYKQKKDELWPISGDMWDDVRSKNSAYVEIKRESNEKVREKLDALKHAAERRAHELANRYFNEASFPNNNALHFTPDQDFDIYNLNQTHKIDFSKMSEQDLLNFILENNKPQQQKLPGRINLNRRNEVFPNLDYTRFITDDTKTALSDIFHNIKGVDYLNDEVAAINGANIFDIGNGGFKLGEFNIPLFGTDEFAKGTISGTNPQQQKIFKLSDFLKFSKYGFDKSTQSFNFITENYPMQTTGDVNYNANIPKEYIDALQHNINYLKQLFPGSKEFGSSSVAVKGTPHNTHDIDLIISDADFATNVKNKFLNKSGTNWRETRPNDTYTIRLDPKYGEAGDLDFNVVWTDPVTGMADANKGTVGLELFRQFFPKDYAKAVTESMQTLNPVKINKTPKELIDAYDPAVKTVLDSFSSSKSKHLPRAEAHLTTTDPNIVEKALDQYLNEKLGGTGKLLPITREMFTNVETNSRIFDELGYKGVDKNTVINDPAKMKNLINYWYIHNSIFGRGVNPQSIPTNVVDHYINKGMTKDQALYYATKDAMSKWNSDSLGGSANGAGLNTVTLGDSGHGSIYGFMQPDINVTGNTAEEILHNAKRALGYYDYKFSNEDIKKISEILGYNFTGNTPEELLKNIPVNESGKIILQRLKDELGIHALSKKYVYGHRGGRYNSMTGDLSINDALFYNYKNKMELPVSDEYRDEYSYTDNSKVVSELQSKLKDLGSNWSHKKALETVKNSKLGRQIEMFHEGAKHFDELSRQIYSNEKINTYVEQTIQKNYPELYNEMQKAKTEYVKAKDEYENMQNQINELIHQYADYNGRAGKIRAMANEVEYKISNLKHNIRSIALLSVFGGIPAEAVTESIIKDNIMADVYEEAYKQNQILLQQKQSGKITDEQYEKLLMELINGAIEEHSNIYSKGLFNTGKRKLSERQARFNITQYYPH